MSPSLAPFLSCKTLEDLHHSDHFPNLCNLESVPREQQQTRKKWKQDNADWPNFSNEVSFSDDLLDAPIDDLVEHITNQIITVANNNIPSTSTTPKKCVPWWNKNIKEAIAARRKSLSIFKTFPTTENFINFKRLRAKARRLIKASKQSSWESFLGQINPQTTRKGMWNCVRRINRGSKYFVISQMEENGVISVNLTEICNILGRTFSKNSDSSGYSPAFRNFITLTENYLYNFESDNSEIYNHPFLLSEIENAVKDHQGSAQGPDNITYNMIKNLKSDHKNFVLKVFNRIGAKL